MALPHGLSGHWHHCQHVSTHGSEGRTGYAEVQNINKQVVESHVEAAHHDAQEARRAHVARAFQHVSHQMITHHERQCKRKYKKI